MADTLLTPMQAIIHFFQNHPVLREKVNAGDAEHQNPWVEEAPENFTTFPIIVVEHVGSPPSYTFEGAYEEEFSWNFVVFNEGLAATELSAWFVIAAFNELHDNPDRLDIYQANCFEVLRTNYQIIPTGNRSPVGKPVFGVILPYSMKVTYDYRIG